MDRIYDYIYDDLNNPIAAEKTVKGILKKISEIKEYPRLGPVWYLENNINNLTSSAIENNSKDDITGLVIYYQ